jgi:hypothetical protein
MSVKLTASRESEDGPHLAPSEAAHAEVSSLPTGASLQAELDAMVADLKGVVMEVPDEVLKLCQAYMARCTEIQLFLVRNEGGNRERKFIRTQQLKPVMELIDFTFKAASRTVEIHRQDVELTR